MDEEVVASGPRNLLRSGLRSSRAKTARASMLDRDRFERGSSDGPDRSR
jgi:hypothetical protein